ncbi:MAG: hypothetical protein U0183_34695 [Polyangiaceae bacterium]
MTLPTPSRVSWRAFGAVAITLAGALGACLGPEECEPSGFGVQCRGPATATCSPRPDRYGGGAVVDTQGCHETMACSEAYGALAAVCMPATSSVCRRDPLRALAKDAPVAVSRDGKHVAVASGKAIEVFAYPSGPAVRLDVTDAPTAMLFADMNGDGEPDLVLGAEGGTRVSLRKGPELLPPTLLANESTLHAAGDLDGDGLDDVVVSRAYDLKVVFGGPERRTVPLDVSTLGPVVAVGDVSGDGKPELVVVGVGEGLGMKLSVLSFASDRSARSWAVPIGETASSGSINGVTIYGSPSALALSDMDGDGIADAVVGSLGKNLAVFRGGEAGFARGAMGLTLAEPSALAPLAGGGVVASLARTPVVAVIPRLDAQVLYRSAPTLEEAAKPIPVPQGTRPLFRTATALVGDCTAP